MQPCSPLPKPKSVLDLSSGLKHGALVAWVIRLFQDSDVHITLEDQQKINTFAKHNAKLEDYKDELKSKQAEMTNLAEACDELDLMDDDIGEIPFYMGEVFINQDMESTKALLDETKLRVESEIAALRAKSVDLRALMANLKAQLYAKFGNHINLEADEE